MDERQKGESNRQLQVAFDRIASANKTWLRGPFPTDATPFSTNASVRGDGGLSEIVLRAEELEHPTAVRWLFKRDPLNSTTIVTFIFQRPSKP
jgi:hypothetical protein